MNIYRCKECGNVGGHETGSATASFKAVTIDGVEKIECRCGSRRVEEIEPMSRLVPIEQAGRDFDFVFWQKLGPDSILRAAWEMVVTAERLKNPDADLRLRRDVAVLKPLRG
jgi:hypothetical protein